MIVRNIIEQLSNKEREIIKMSFGFYNNKIYTQQEIARKLSVSQSYVSKTMKIILKRLQEEFGKIELEDERLTK